MKTETKHTIIEALAQAKIKEYRDLQYFSYIGNTNSFAEFQEIAAKHRKGIAEDADIYEKYRIYKQKKKSICQKYKNILAEIENS